MMTTMRARIRDVAATQSTALCSTMPSVVFSNGSPAQSPLVCPTVMELMAISRAPPTPPAASRARRAFPPGAVALVGECSMPVV